MGRIRDGPYNSTKAFSIGQMIEDDDEDDDEDEWLAQGSGSPRWAVVTVMR